MCMACMGAAVTAVGSASGIRAWIAAKRPPWMTPSRLKLLTVALLTVAVVASGIGVG